MSEKSKQPNQSNNRNHKQRGNNQSPNQSASPKDSNIDPKNQTTPTAADAVEQKTPDNDKPTDKTAKDSNDPSVKTDKNSSEPTTDNNKHSQAENTDLLKQTESSNGGNGLSMLALAASLAAAGMGWYALKQNDNSQTSAELDSVNSKITSLTQSLHTDDTTQALAQQQQALSKLDEQVSTLSASISDAPAPDTLSEAQVKALIQNQLTQLPKPLTVEDITALVGTEMDKTSAPISTGISAEDVQKQIDQALSHIDGGVAMADVQSQIKQALANFAQDETSAPKFDFSNEIALVKQSEANARQAVSDIEQRAATISSHAEQALSSIDQRATTINAQAQQALNDIDQHATAVQTQLQQASDNIDQLLSAANATLQTQAEDIKQSLTQVETPSNPAPVIALLQLADLAAKSANPSTAARYLQQASTQFSALNLNQAPYEAFKAPIEELAQTYQSVADKPAPATQLDEIIRHIDDWSFKQTQLTVSDSSDQDSAAPSSFMGKVKNVGQGVINSVVTVTRTDDNGLSWINQDMQLQQIIRLNVRLDLAYARNALQIGDQAGYQDSASQLQTQITRYFDDSDAQVAQALNTLSSLSADSAQLPDISALINDLNQATAQE